MARGRTANFQKKRERGQNTTSKQKSKALDETITEFCDKISEPFMKVSLRITKLYNKNLMIASFVLFTILFVIMGKIESAITKYTYEKENISEIKYKSVFNGHYNYKSSENYETLDAMEEGGRKIYLIYNIILVFLYSPLLCLSITQSIAAICGHTKTNLFIVVGSILQMVESSILFFTTYYYPNKKILLDIAGKVAMVKYYFIFVTIFVIIFGLIDAYKLGKSQKEEENKKQN